MKVNVLVAGRTGVGKTSLIKAMTYAGTVPEKAIGEKGAPCTRGYDEYETDAAIFVDAEGMDGGQSVKEYLDFINDERRRRMSKGKAEQIFHCVWYCIDGSGARVQNGDREIIKELSPHVIVAVTKAELMRDKQKQDMIDSLLEFHPRDQLLIVSSHKATGLDELASNTMRVGRVGINEAKKWECYYAEVAAIRRRRRTFRTNLPWLDRLWLEVFDPLSNELCMNDEGDI